MLKIGAFLKYRTIANTIVTVNRHSEVVRKANFPDKPGKKVVTIIYGHLI